MVAEVEVEVDQVEILSSEQVELSEVTEIKKRLEQESDQIYTKAKSALMVKLSYIWRIRRIRRIRKILTI
jgi:hypothetical protein